MSQPKVPVVTWFIAGNEPPYGLSRAVLQLAHTVQHKGWQVNMIAMTDGPFAAQCRTEGFTVVAVDGEVPPTFKINWRLPLRLAKTYFIQCKTATRCARVIEELNTDILHVMVPQLISIAGNAARKAGVPCYWEIPNYVSKRFPLSINRWIYQWTCFRQRVRPLANSAATARTLGDWPVKARVVHLGADAAVFDPDEVTPVGRQEVGIPNEAIVLGIVARITPSKGQDRVLKAMLAAHGGTDPLHLLLLGGSTDDTFANSLRQLAADAGAADRLHFTGLVDHPERYYPIMDIVVNSRVDLEPFGLSVIEAMMMRRPVLVHAFGGPAETVRDGVTGWHVSQPTVDAFRQGIERALENRNQWHAMGDAAREHALKSFSSQVHAETFMTIVAETLSAK